MAVRGEHVVFVLFVLLILALLVFTTRAASPKGDTGPSEHGGDDDGQISLSGRDMNLYSLSDEDAAFLRTLPNYRDAGSVTFANHDAAIKEIWEANRAVESGAHNEALALSCAHAISAGWHIVNRAPLRGHNWYGQMISKAMIESGVLFCLVRDVVKPVWKAWRWFPNSKESVEAYRSGVRSYGTAGWDYLLATTISNFDVPRCTEYVEKIIAWFGPHYRKDYTLVERKGDQLYKISATSKHAVLKWVEAHA